MPLLNFHPAVSRWFMNHFESPTEPQRLGWPAIQSGRHTLISAPTGSGKTLAAFLASLDQLFRESAAGTLPDETRVLYVSPLKALSNDIRKNLEEPLSGIAALLRENGAAALDVRAEVRTGDTPAARRQAMIRRPPHILVTTPESFYLLLTSASGQRMLRTVRTLIVDEIHAVADDRRGSHLALSIERLEALVGSFSGYRAEDARQEPCVFPLTPSLSPSGGEGARRAGEGVRPGPSTPLQADRQVSPTRIRKSQLQRIGLSATQKPIEEVARFLVGSRAIDSSGIPDCQIVNIGHSRAMDLAVEIPDSPLEAVMSNEVWEEVYGRLAKLIEEHRTTLVFVNTRRLAERLTHHLSPRLGADKVTSHHGSLSAKLRLDAENRLKQGELKALVATASLELGIDIGAVDLVCQLGCTRSIATFLQRIGRANHQRGGLPKGRLFPLSRDELVECAALIRSVRQGQLDCLRIPEKPLDVLAQQIVATAAGDDWDKKALFELARGAYPYRNLTETEFDAVIKMLAEGFSTRRGRRGALLHYDGVHRRIRARRGARLVALTSGGAIPDNADYRVVLEPSETFIGTVNEDFAVESMAGEIFQLGNASWKIVRIISGMIRVEDARGQPPGLPFWLGEAPARTDELTRAVSDLRAEIERRIAGGVSRAQFETHVSGSTGYQPVPSGNLPGGMAATSTAIPAGKLPTGAGRLPAPPISLVDTHSVEDWLTAETGLSQRAVAQITHYFESVHKALGLIPTQRQIVLERFFDESGGMQLVLHAPFGSRVNRAWGLALRKRFCRSFNFELQAAATEDAIVLSLGTQHSFPLDEVFRYLNAKTVRDLLVQALLDAPMFTIRWRWNTSRALAVPRQRGQRRNPPPFQRMEAENLLAAVFPDQLACLENIVGDREVPDHPLVQQTIRDCLEEAMDIDGLIDVLHSIERGKIQCVARDLPEPSPLAHEILNAKPYAFLDNAPLEERRTQAVYARRAFEPTSDAAALGALDGAAIERVRAEAWPRAENPDEMHDALLLMGVTTEEEARTRESDANGPSDGRALLEALAATGRAGRLSVADSASAFWVAAERLPMLRAVHPNATVTPDLALPAEFNVRAWERSEALRELVRGRMEVAGPITAGELAGLLGILRNEIDAALLALEAEGFVLRGRFRPGAPEQEWCDRRLLARIHRLTINRLRAEIQPVSVSEFCRFLLAWQRVDAEHRVEGPDGVEAVLRLLDGFELPVAAWEPDVLARRVNEYDPHWLDQLCLTGRIGWGRLTPPQNQKARAFSLGPLRSSPVALFQREHLATWLELSKPELGPELSPDTERVGQVLTQSGALFFGELVRRARLLPTQVEQALGELAALGVVTADSFEGLRALLVPSHKRPTLGGESVRPRRHKIMTSVEFAGRWSLLRAVPTASASTQNLSDTSALVSTGHQPAWPKLLRIGEGPPVSSGNLPDGTGVASKSNPGAGSTATPATIPVGRLPIGAGKLPAPPIPQTDSQSSDASRLRLEERSDEAVETFARTLLNRYGVVFRRLLERESMSVSWFELGRVYRRWEACGEIRGGHFVAGVSGEQYALPEAIGLLRSLRKAPPQGEMIALSGADPLNLVGILTPGPRIAALAANRILFRDGLPVAALEAGEIRVLDSSVAASDLAVEKALKIGQLPVLLRPYYA